MFFTCRSEQGLELDLFLLQCCAALAPPDLYVKRIVERFGLLDYLSLSLERSNEYAFIPLKLYIIEMLLISFSSFYKFHE